MAKTNTPTWSAVRVSADTRDDLHALQSALSNRLGTRLTLAQTVQMAVHRALENESDGRS